MFTYESLSCFKERPHQSIRFLVGRNLEQIIKLCIVEATQFINTAQTKGKALDQLKYTLLIGEQKITKHVESIIKALIKISQLQIENVGLKMKHIVEIIGFHVKSSYYIPLMVSMLSQEQIKNSNKNTIIMLNLLGHMFRRSQGLEYHIPELIKLLSHYQALFYDNDEGLCSIFEICSTLLSRLDQQKVDSKFTNIAFSILINVQATKTISKDTRKEAVTTLDELARKSGYASVSDLHAAEVGPILERIITKKEYISWNRTSKDRFKFDTIVRNCYSEVSRFLQSIIQIFEFLIHPQNDLETRMDTLVLIQYVLEIKQLKESLAPYSEQLLKKVLIPSIQWKIGKPQIKIRKAGVINAISLIQKKIINEEQLLDSFKDLLPHLKSCLTDDWAPELRLASCDLVEKFLLATKQKIGDEQLKDLYPSLLERLDDSQDAIRKKVTISVNVFFSCRYIKLSESTFEYMIGAIFVHFDDNSEEIQDAILVSLRYAALVDPKLVLKNAKSNLKRMKNKEKCSELIAYCEQLIEEQ